MRKLLASILGMSVKKTESSEAIAMAFAPAEGGKSLVNYGTNNATSASSFEDNENNVRGNRWVTYESAVDELTRKYLGQAKYGCGSAHAVVSFMAAEIAGNGAILTSSNPETQKFLDAYTRWNKLDSVGFFNTVRVGVIEGKILREPILKKNAKEKLYEGWTVKTKLHRWVNKKYEVTLDDDEAESIKMDKDTELQKGKFVFTQIDGFLDDPQNSRSPASKCLQYMESIDHVASDLRLYNKKFPAVTPVFEMDSTEAAAWLHKKMFRKVTTDQQGNERFVQEWTIGDALMLPNGRATLLEPQGNAVKSLIEELMLDFRLISGTLGMPVIYLGPVDLPSSKATAQEATEMLNASTITPRESYENAIKEEAIIAADMLAEKLMIKIPTDDIVCKVPFVNMSWMELIAEFYSKLALADVISLDTLREMIATIDPKREKQRMLEQRKEEADRERSTVLQGNRTPADRAITQPTNGNGTPTTQGAAAV